MIGYGMSARSLFKGRKSMKAVSPDRFEFLNKNESRVFHSGLNKKKVGAGYDYSVRGCVADDCMRKSEEEDHRMVKSATGDG
jgi:hypothetical protein